MEIKFYWNGGFCGNTYHMEVDGKYIPLGDFGENLENSKLKAIQILKDEYGIDFEYDKIEFIWGGCL